MTKERITITVDHELLEWLDKKTDEKLFANRSHGIEFLIAQKIKEESQLLNSKNEISKSENAKNDKKR